MGTGGEGKGDDGKGGPYSGGNALGQLSSYSGSRKKGAYKEWRKEVLAFTLSFIIPEEQVGPRVWLRLQGEAKDAVAHLELDSDIAQKGGLEQLLAALDDVFEEEECDKIDEVVTSFWTHGESMESYMNRFAQARRLMQKEDPETTIGDKAYAVRLLKRAGLKKEEQQAVLSATNAEYDKDAIETAMKRLFKNIGASDAKKPENFQRKGFRKGAGKSKQQRPFRRSHGAQTAEVDEDDDGEEEGGGAYYEEDEEDSDDDDPFGILAADDDDDDSDDPEMLEAMASFQSAKKRLASVKKNSQRGFAKGGGKGKNENIEEKKKKSHCSDCRQAGHWHGDPECPKVKSGEVKPYIPKTKARGANFVDWELVKEEAEERKEAAATGASSSSGVWTASSAKEAPKPKAKAEPKPKAKPKAKAGPTNQQLHCTHPKSQQKAGHNQYCKWVNCGVCGLRLRTTSHAGSFVGMAECMGAEESDGEEEGEPDPDGSKQAAVEEVLEELGVHISGVHEQTTLDPTETNALEEMIKKVSEHVGTGIWDTGCRKRWRARSGSRIMCRRSPSWATSRSGHRRQRSSSLETKGA